MKTNKVELRQVIARTEHREGLLGRVQPRLGARHERPHMRRMRWAQIGTPPRRSARDRMDGEAHPLPKAKFTGCGDFGRLDSGAAQHGLHARWIEFRVVAEGVEDVLHISISLVCAPSLHGGMVSPGGCFAASLELRRLSPAVTE